MARRAHTRKKKKGRKENKHNPADKSKIVLAFIWTCGGALLRLNPNETAACPGWIHHRWIGVISASTFNQASLFICSRPSQGPTASIRSPQNLAEGCISKILPFLLKRLVMSGGRGVKKKNTNMGLVQTGLHCCYFWGCEPSVCSLFGFIPAKGVNDWSKWCHSSPLRTSQLSEREK